MALVETIVLTHLDIMGENIFATFPILILTAMLIRTLKKLLTLETFSKVRYKST